MTFVKNELKKIQKILCSEYPGCLESQMEDEEELGDEEVKQRKSSREAFLKITQHFLRRMNQEELADHLQSSKRIQHISHLLKKLIIFINVKCLNSSDLLVFCVVCSFRISCSSLSV